MSFARVGKKLISHPFCEYGGPLPLVKKINGQEFQKDLFFEFQLPVRINLHPHLLNYFEGFNLKEGGRNTYWIKNLSKLGTGEFLSSLRYDIRHSIKKAEKRFGFVDDPSEKDLEEFYNLYVKTMKRHKNLHLVF